MEQIGASGDFPSRRAGPRVVLPRQGSAAAGAEQLADIFFWRSSRFSPRTGFNGLFIVDEHLPDSAEWVQLRDEATSKALLLEQTHSRDEVGSRRRASESSGSARRALEGRSGTGTRVPVCQYI